MAALVDRMHKLRVVQLGLLTQKLSAMAMSGLMIGLFQRLSSGQQTKEALLALIILAGCVNKVSSVTATVAVERDWALIIAEDYPNKLTSLNTWLRRIDLVSKLLAPLFASLLTSVTSYTWAFTALIAIDFISIVFELICKLFRSFPVYIESV